MRLQSVALCVGLSTVLVTGSLRAQALQETWARLKQS